MLLAHHAQLKYCKQDKLNEFLQQHPNPQVAIRQEEENKRKKKKEEEEKERQEQVPVTLSPATWQRLHENTLGDMNDEAITQDLVAGKLACGFSSQLVWADIVKRVQEHETARVQENQPTVSWRREQATLDARRQQVQVQLAQLQQNLQELNQQYDTLEQRIQEHAAAPRKRDLSSLLAFAERVQPIEQRLVAQLEEEMNKKKPQLSALSDHTGGTAPKLSLLLNCMGVQEAAIAATRDLNNTAFKRLTKRIPDFTDRYRSDSVSAEDIKDLLYCGEMMRECDFPFGDHDVECVVCINHTAQQLANFIKERHDIDLPAEVLAHQNINGRRVLYAVASDFPEQSKRQVMEALDRLRDLHEEAL